MADEIGQIQKSAALGASLERAHRLALEQGHGAVTLEHLLFAMTDDPEAATVLVASGLSMDRLRTEVSGYIARIAESLPRLGPNGALPNQDFLRVLNLAATAARQSQRSSIDGAIVLAAIVGDGKTTAAALLKSQGLTFEEVIKVLSRHAASRPASAPPSSAQVSPGPPPPAAAPPAMDMAPGPAAVAPSPGSPPVPGKAATDDLLQSVRERVKLSEPPRIPVRGPAMQVPTVEASPAGAAVRPVAAPSFPAAPADAQQRGPDTPGQPAAHPTAPPPLQMAPPPASPPEWSAPPAPPPIKPPQPAPQAEQPPRLPPRLPPQVAPPPIASPPQRADGRAPAGEPYPSGPPPQPRSAPHGAGPGSGPMPAGPMPGPGPQVGAPPPSPPSFGAPPPPRPAGGGQSRVPSLDQRLAEYRPQDVRGGQPLPAHMLQAPAPAPAPAPMQAPQPAFHAPARATDGGFAPPRPDLAQAAVGVPEQMTIGRPSRVEVRLDPVDFLGGPTAARGPAPASRSRPLRAVSLRLFDETGAFAIEPETDETRWLDAGQPAALTEPLTWSFLVTPRARGTRTLGISLDTRAIGPLGFIGEPPITPEMVEVRVRRDLRAAMRRLFVALLLAASGAAVWATAGGLIVTGVRAAMRLAGLR